MIVLNIYMGILARGTAKAMDSAEKGKYSAAKYFYSAEKKEYSAAVSADSAAEKIDSVAETDAFPTAAATFRNLPVSISRHLHL